MKNSIVLLFSLLFICTVSRAQPCSNFDFETGTFAGWTGAKGKNTTSSYGPLNSIVPGIFSNGIDASIHDSLARHTIVTTASGNDSCGGFPCVFPGGNYSMRLGNTSAIYQGQYLEQAFLVTDSVIMVNYALVLSTSGHSAGEEPYFKIEALDNSANLIPSGTTFISEYDTLLPLQPCSTFTTSLPWTTDTINLAAYIGTTVTLRFTTAGCIYAGHFAYAYIDASCSGSITGIPESTSSGMILQPNPATSDLAITLPERTRHGPFQLIVYDGLGREIFHDKISGEPPGGIIRLNSATWAEGIYTVVIKGENTTLRGKLVKQ